MSKIDGKVINEKDMARSLGKALRKSSMKLLDGTNLRCDDVIIEQPFKGARFDVVGYNKEENTVYIVECKFKADITSIGHAFGQILAYEVLLHRRSYEFLKGFVDKMKTSKKIKSEDLMNIVKGEVINFRFFIALRDPTRNLYEEIREMKEKLSFKVGVILVDKNGRCRTQFTGEEEIVRKLQENDLIQIKISKKFRLNEFLKEIRQRMISQKYCPPNKVSLSNRLIQLRLFPDTHYEVWFKKKKKKIEIGLHIEPQGEKRHQKIIAEKIISYLRNRKMEINSLLGKDVKIEKWGKGWKGGEGAFWGKIYEEIDMENLDENLLEKIVKRLKQYIDSLQPLLLQLDQSWSKND